jgi:hypothetical protein
MGHSSSRVEQHGSKHPPPPVNNSPFPTPIIGLSIKNMGSSIEEQANNDNENGALAMDKHPFYDDFFIVLLLDLLININSILV